MYRDDTGIEIIREPGIKYIDPRRLVEIASRVIDTNAQVVEFWNTPDEFRLDVITPENFDRGIGGDFKVRSEEHTSELQSRENLVCRLLLEKKKKKTPTHT